MDRMMVISSDGHATARMDDYTPYLDQEFREEFRDFCAVYRERGTHTFEERALSQRLDPYLMDEWRENVIDAARHGDDVRLDGVGAEAVLHLPDRGEHVERLAGGVAELRRHAGQRTATVQFPYQEVRPGWTIERLVVGDLADVVVELCQHGVVRVGMLANVHCGQM